MGTVGRRRMIVAALVLSVALGAAGQAAAGPVAAAPAAAEDENRFARDFGYGVGAFFTNLVYMPAKFVYATLGGVTGGFAYVLTGLKFDVAKRIWVPSTGGDYVVTPSMLKGEEPIYFSGETKERHASHAGAAEEDLDAKPGTTGGAAPKSY
jgi:hypothetical protein